MGKSQNKTINIKYDIEVGFSGIVPSRKDDYSVNSQGTHSLKPKSKSEEEYINRNTPVIDDVIKSKGNEDYPCTDEILILIVQYFISRNEYRRHDIDNKARTILNILEGKFYKNDVQVKSMLVTKRMSKRVPDNFTYVSIKKLSLNSAESLTDEKLLQFSGIERSVLYYQAVRKTITF